VAQNAGGETAAAKIVERVANNIYMVRVPRSFPSFREHRLGLTRITIHANLGHAEVVYSSFQIRLKNGVPRSLFLFLDLADSETWLLCSYLDGYKLKCK
jgi:hypothetical protein